MSQVYITSDNTQVIITEENGTEVTVFPSASPTIVFTADGPQGPAGAVEGILPTGGDPGNILIKDTNVNYDASWVATLDGGTFN